jgi:hypothetical protein
MPFFSHSLYTITHPSLPSIGPSGYSADAVGAHG